VDDSIDRGISFGVVTRVYLRDSSLIDMTADKQTRGAASINADQIGKVFVAIARDMRKCLVCEQLFTRRASAEHAKRVCYPARS
jgi:hypothetical protein